MARLPLLLVVPLAFACSRELQLSEPPPPAAAVVVTAIEPAHGFEGQTLRVEGTGFAATAEQNQVLFAASSARPYAIDEAGALLVRVPDAAGVGSITVVTPTERSAPGPEFAFMGYGRPRVGAIAQRQRLLHRPSSIVGLYGAPVYLSRATRSLHADVGRLDVDEDVTAVLGLPDGSAIVATCPRAFGGCDLTRPAWTLWRWQDPATPPTELFSEEGTLAWGLLEGAEGGLIVLTGIEGRRDPKLHGFTTDDASFKRTTRLALPANALHQAARAGAFVLGVEQATSLVAATPWVLDLRDGTLRTPTLPVEAGGPLEIVGPVAAATLGAADEPWGFASVGSGWLLRFRLDRLDALADGTDAPRWIDLVNRTSPGALAIAPEELVLAATRPETGRVSLVDLEVDEAVASIPAGVEPRALAFDAWVRRFYAADEGDNAIEIVDPISRTSIARASTLLGVNAETSAYVVRGNDHLIAVATDWADTALALDGRTLDVVGPFGRSDGLDAVLPADEGRGWVSGRTGLGLVSLVTGAITPMLPPPCDGLGWRGLAVDASGAAWLTHSRAYTCPDGRTLESRIVRVALDGTFTERGLAVEAAPWLIALADGVVATTLPDGVNVELQRFTSASMAEGDAPVGRFSTLEEEGVYFLGVLPFQRRLAAFFSTGDAGQSPRIVWFDDALVEEARVDSIVDGLPLATLPDGAHFVVLSGDAQRLGVLRMDGDVPTRLFSTAIGGTAVGVIVSPDGERLLVPVRETDELVVIE